MKINIIRCYTPKQTKKTKAKKTKTKNKQTLNQNSSLYR